MNEPAETAPARKTTLARFAPALVLSVALSLIGYGAVVLWSGSEETLGAMARLHPLGWLLVLALAMGNYLSRCARWLLYLGRLGHRDIPTPGHVAIYFSGFALTTTPGKAGEAIRAVFLKRLFEVPYPRSFSALFSERLMDLLSVLILIVLAVPAFAGGNLRGLASLLVLVALALLPLLHHRGLLAWLTGRARRLPRRLRVAALHLLSLVKSSGVLLRGGTLYAGLGLGLIAWALEGVGLYVIAQTLGVELSLTAAVGIYALSTLIGALSMVPGGLGGTEISMVALLMAAGADQATATAATLICRITSLWFAVLLGLPMLALMAHRSLSRPSEAAG